MENEWIAKSDIDWRRRRSLKFQQMWHGRKWIAKTDIDWRRRRSLIFGQKWHETNVTVIYQLVYCSPS